MTNNPSISRRETAESEGFERDAQRSGKVLKPASFTMDYLAEAIFWVDPDSRIVDVNETACSMLGYTREELLSLTVLEIDPNFTADRWTSVWKTFKGQGKITLETAPRTKGGRIIHVEIMASHLCLEGRELACAFARDITERKVMLEQLEKSERKHRRLHESMRDGFVCVDMTGAIKEYNETYRTMLGYSRDEIEATRSPAQKQAIHRETCDQYSCCDARDYSGLGLHCIAQQCHSPGGES